MTETGLHDEALTLDSERLCLDFANTADWHASEQPEEGLNSYADLVAWAQSVNLLPGEAARRLLDEAARAPERAADTLLFARSFREATYRIFAAVAAGETPQPGDLDILNALLDEALLRLRIVARGGGFVWEWAVDPGTLHQMLWPVAYSAAGLLTSDDVQRVGQCADDRGCGFLFVDTSKNHTRRWCGTGCANRAKAQRHYARVKDTRDK